jgi:hypothetical protein
MRWSGNASEVTGKKEKEVKEGIIRPNRQSSIINRMGQKKKQIFPKKSSFAL